MLIFVPDRLDLFNGFCFVFAACRGLFLAFLIMHGIMFVGDVFS